MPKQAAVSVDLGLRGVADQLDVVTVWTIDSEADKLAQRVQGHLGPDWKEKTMKSRLIRSASAMLGAALLAIGMAAPASAEAPDDQFDQVRVGFSQLGMSAADANLLIEKLRVGQVPDSLKGDVDPVRTDTFIQSGDAEYAKDGNEVTVRWYPDGSPAVTAREIPVERSESNGVTTRSIQGCDYTSGSGFSTASGCTISGWWGTVQIAFMGTYTLVQGGADYIYSTWGGWQQCVWPTTCSEPGENAANYNEGSNPAFSRWSATVTTPAASWQVWMQLNVGGDSAWSSSS